MYNLSYSMQVTTHSHLLSYGEVQTLSKVFPGGEGSTVSFLLQEFDTELDFFTRIRLNNEIDVSCS